MYTPCIDDLKYSDILIIADAIEKYTLCECWSEIAKQITLARNEITVHEIEFLKHGYTVEESMCWAFLQSLPTKFVRCDIAIFKLIALKFRRMDICFYLDKLNDPSRNIWKLPIAEQKELVYYLDKKSIRNDWKMFADELGYSASKITEFNSSLRHYERPTVLLFNILLSKYPTMELHEIGFCCQKAGRNDVEKKIRLIEKRISDSKLEQ